MSTITLRAGWCLLAPVSLHRPLTRWGETQYAAAGFDSNIWILKPVDLSRGRGISLIRDKSQVVLGENVIVQKYIERVSACGVFPLLSRQWWWRLTLARSSAIVGGRLQVRSATLRTGHLVCTAGGLPVPGRLRAVRHPALHNGV